jgi:hypothetical protein
MLRDILREYLIAQKNIGGLFARQFFCLNAKKTMRIKKEIFSFNRGGVYED